LKYELFDCLIFTYIFFDECWYFNDYFEILKKVSNFSVSLEFSKMKNSKDLGITHLEVRVSVWDKIMNQRGKNGDWAQSPGKNYIKFIIQY